jgi:hypothetical protein
MVEMATGRRRTRGFFPLAEAIANIGFRYNSGDAASVFFIFYRVWNYERSEELVEQRMKGEPFRGTEAGVNISSIFCASGERLVNVRVS